MGKKQMALEEIITGVVRDYKEIYSDRLESIVLYGGAERDDSVSAHSGIQFLIVLNSKGILDLEDSFDAVKRWSKEGVAVPLFLTRHYIDGALDSYPIEFLVMKSSYRLVYGEDPIGSLEIGRAAVRLQAERDARGYLLRLRQGYLECGGDANGLRALVTESVPGFHALFRALFWLITGEMGGPTADVTRRMCDEFDLSHFVFEELEDIRRGGKRRAGDLLRLVDSYLEEARKLVLRIDALENRSLEESHG